MGEFAVRARGLGKRYFIGGQRERYKTLRDTLTDAVAGPIRRAGKLLRGQASGAAELDEIIWALKDLSFEVRWGEVIGIVGHNGAGKSTLLKVLSRVTEPTEGRVEMYGRVGALLEVGTGFHNELTGRENIYLNGAILGMSRHEIDAKFDEIVSFSEVERFIDTPIKHYSTGMKLRLGFAVAVHLEPEILVVDEVLAVGDARFQRKCLTKMQSVGTSGRTILFVSHNMAAVRNICQQAIWLDQGQIAMQGDVDEVVDQYVMQMRADDSNQAVETPGFILNQCEITGLNGGLIKTFEPAQIRLRFMPKFDADSPDVHVSIMSVNGTRLAGVFLRDLIELAPIKAGEERETGFVIQHMPMMPGQYELEVRLRDMITLRREIVPRRFPFEVVETPVYGGRRPKPGMSGTVGLQIQGFEHNGRDH